MSYCRAVGNLMGKQRICVSYWWQTQNRGCVLTDSSLPCRSNCSFVDLLSRKNTLNTSRNFSKTCTLCSSGGVNQRKEKMKNYVVFGGIMLFSVVVFTTHILLPRIENYDRVYIEIPKEQKK